MHETASGVSRVLGILLGEPADFMMLCGLCSMRSAVLCLCRVWPGGRISFHVCRFENAEPNEAPHTIGFLLYTSTVERGPLLFTYTCNACHVRAANVPRAAKARHHGI